MLASPFTAHTAHATQEQVGTFDSDSSILAACFFDRARRRGCRLRFRVPRALPPKMVDGTVRGLWSEYVPGDRRSLHLNRYCAHALLGDADDAATLLASRPELELLHIEGDESVAPPVTVTSLSIELVNGAGARVRSLVLNALSIDDGAASMLARTLTSAAPLVEEVDLARNRVGDVGARALAHTARSARWRALLLSRNMVGDAGAREIAGALGRHLVEVHLDRQRCRARRRDGAVAATADSPLGVDGVIALARAVEERGTAKVLRVRVDAASSTAPSERDDGVAYTAARHRLLRALASGTAEARTRPRRRVLIAWLRGDLQREHRGGSVSSLRQVADPTQRRFFELLLVRLPDALFHDALAPFL